MAHFISQLSEKVGGTRPGCPPPNCAHGWDESQWGFSFYGVENELFYV